MTFNYSLRPVALGLATWVLVSAAGAQEAVVAKNVIGDSSITVPGAPPLPQFAMLASPKPPKVTCEGSQLTIAADNSTLGEVLSAVHSCIGVKVDIPDSAARKRIFEKLGPGPAREVLESLLNGTELNFVIGASPEDPQKVDAVFLLQQSTQTSTTAVAADKSTLTPGRRAWLQSRQNALPGPLRDDNTPSAVDPTDIPAADEAMPDPSKAAISQATAGNTTPPAADAPAASTDTAPTATPVTTSTTAPVSASVANPVVNPDKSTSERITDMQQMFEQRRQITQAQNQGQPPSSTQNQAPTPPQP